MNEDADSKPGGKNGKKEGLSGSSFFTWFMVIALLGVWTSVAVVWFELVDYEDVLAKAKDFRYNLSEVLQGKLGVYDADGDGDFDVEDAKILLGLKERTVFEKTVEDSDETVSKKSGLSDADLADVLEDIQYDDANDIEDAMDDHETYQSQYDDVSDFDLEDAVDPTSEYDVVSDFDLEDAVEPSVHESVRSEYEAKDEPAEAESETEETAIVDEEETEEQTFEEVDEPEQEPAAVEDGKMEYLTLDDEPETVHEPLIKESEADILETPNTEADNEAADEEEAESEEEPIPLGAAEEIPALVVDEEPQAEEVEAEEEAADEEESQDDHETEVPEDQEEFETYEESVLTVEETAAPEPDEDEQENEYSPEAEVEEAAEISETVEEYVAEQTEYSTPESLDPESTDEDDIIEADALILDDNEEDIDDSPLDNEHSEPEEETLQPPAEEQIIEDEQIEVEQKVADENPVEDDRPSDKAADPNSVPSEEQTEEHAGDESLSQEKKKKEKQKKPKLLNKFDKTIKTELDAAEKLRKKGKVDEALKDFEILVTKYPQSPRARYGKAQCEDDLAEKRRSNDILLRAISSYEEVSGLPNVPKELAKLALKRRANRQQFLGRMQGSLLTLQKLVQMYPEDISLKNDLGVGYLLIGDNKKAKPVYEEVLSLDPSNGFAKVHYGFILKAENKIAESIPYLKEGLLSGEPGTDDGRFYFHLGDALQRVGDKEAYTWYEAGHKKGYFASVWQRSLYNVNGLKAQPWWTTKDTGYTDLVRTLEANWKIIRDEALAVMDDAKGLFLPEDENLRETGDWSQYTLWQQGRKNEKACTAAPKTCGLLDRYPETTGCRRGQIKYSIMHPGTHVWPHTGPTNCRLRMHLGLVIPSGCLIRCANDTRTWEEGKVLIFDDSFEHEVWQNAGSYRLIFIVDVWHPELTQHQRRTLPAI
ncbi:aspartyl/asparaginyl beta-hydroxylase isoform X2 [Mixophyes fleayi]|uniref:aspartyl/asparaginyl beta-hydroxylase isoform X2 n=1 Tax=Mixophyes fleayi TaxID=3061075 RepID=UPI003F4DD41E